MRLRDRVRIESYVQRHDFWLDVAGVSRRRRRAQRTELRANLHDAAYDVGTAAAIAGLGSPRSLAREAGDGTTTGSRGPRWLAGARWAVAAFAVLMVLWTLSLLAFVDGVQAAGASGTVTGSVFPWGGTVTAEVGSGLAVSASVPASVWVLTLGALVVGSRPWLLLSRREGHRKGRVGATT